MSFKENSILKEIMDAEAQVLLAKYDEKELQKYILINAKINNIYLKEISRKLELLLGNNKWYD